MRVINVGKGWVVVAQWFGTERVVYTPAAGHAIRQIRECWGFIAQNN